MTQDGERPIRAHLDAALGALGSLRAVSYLSAHESAAAPGATVLADYKTVLAQLELEALEAIQAAASELRKPTVKDLVDRLWIAGPLTFAQIQHSVAEAGASPGEIETLLNRLRNAGLLEEAAAPPVKSDPALQAEATQPPRSREPGAEITRQILFPPEVGTLPAADDVTATYSVLVTSQGRPWFDERALARGIHLEERINGQF